MLTQYVIRGIKAGIIAGIVFGVFVALISNPLIGHAETFESGGGDPVVSSAISSLTSILGGVLFGVLLGGIVFGCVFYFLEPAIPGPGKIKSYAIAAAGFITISGAPWLVFPPHPPGVTQTLSPSVRVTWYLILMVAGAMACGLSGAVYNYLRVHHRRLTTVTGALVPFAIVIGVAVLAPANPTTGPIPDEVAMWFVLTTIGGQVGLWFVLASVHAWLHTSPKTDTQHGTASETTRAPTSR